MRTSKGHWLAITGATLVGSPGHVAIVLSAATLQQVVPAAAAWYRLTEREEQVLTLLAAGITANLIARKLELSRHTVNEYAASGYRKAGVRGRDELLAQLSGTQVA